MRPRDWLIGAIPIALAVAAGFVVEISGDFHWHVALGNETLDGAGIYSHDVHSYSARGEPMFASSWLADVVFAALYRGGGYAACFVFRAAILGGIAALFLVDARRRGLAIPAAASLVAFAFASRFGGFYLRPELFGLALLAVVLFCLGQHQRTRRPAYLITCMAACAVWANLHGSVGVGLLAIGLYCAQQVLTEWFFGERNRSSLTWALVTPPAAFAAACLSPEGIGAPLAVDVVSDLWVSQVSEWAPFPVRHLTPMLQVALGTAVATTIAALLSSRRALWLAVYVAVLIALTAAFRRFAVFAMLAAVPLVADNLVVIAERATRHRTWEIARRGLPALALAWSLVSVALAERGITSLRVGIDDRLTSYPTGACEYIESANLPGPVFNAYGMGGYLMFCLGKDHPVLIDGRAWSLYSDELFARYVEATRSPAAWVELADDYPADWAVVGYTGFGSMAGHSARWRAVYFDDSSVVFRARDAPGKLEVFTYLNPFRLSDLPDLAADALAAAEGELSRQSERCPACYRTDLARAALAIARADARTVGAIVERMARRGETPELAWLMGRFALMQKDRETAIRFFRRFRALGGDPTLAAELIERATGAGGH